VRLATDCYISSSINRLGSNERSLQHTRDNRIQIAVILIDVVAVRKFFLSLFFISDIRMHNRSGLKIKAETYTGNVNGVYSRVIDVSRNLIHCPRKVFHICTVISRTDKYNVFISTGYHGKKSCVFNEPFINAIMVTNLSFFTI